MVLDTVRPEPLLHPEHEEQRLLVGGGIVGQGGGFVL